MSNNGWAYRFKAIGYDVVTDDPSIQLKDTIITLLLIFSTSWKKILFGRKYTFKPDISVRKL